MSGLEHEPPSHLPSVRDCGGRLPATCLQSVRAIEACLLGTITRIDHGLEVEFVREQRLRAEIRKATNDDGRPLAEDGRRGTRARSARECDQRTSRSARVSE